MEQKQLALLAVSGISAYYATNKIKVENDCKDIYVVLLNSFQLMVFSNFLQQQYLFLAFLIAAVLQMRTYGEYNQEQYSKLLILGGIYLLLGGYDYVIDKLGMMKNMENRENRENYSTDYTNYQGVNMFGRGDLKPDHSQYIDTHDRINGQRNPYDQQIDSRDPSYRQVQLKDYSRYDTDELDSITFNPKPEELKQVENILWIYSNFKYHHAMIKQSARDPVQSPLRVPLSGIFEFYKGLCYRRIDLLANDPKQHIQILRQNIKRLTENPDLEFPRYATLINEESRLHIFLFEILKPNVPNRIYSLVNRKLLLNDIGDDSDSNGLLEGLITQYMRDKDIKLTPRQIYDETDFDLGSETQILKSAPLKDTSKMTEQQLKQYLEEQMVKYYARTGDTQNLAGRADIKNLLQENEKLRQSIQQELRENIIKNENITIQPDMQILTQILAKYDRVLPIQYYSISQISKKHIDQIIQLIESNEISKEDRQNLENLIKIKDYRWIKNDEDRIKFDTRSIIVDGKYMNNKQQEQYYYNLEQEIAQKKRELDSIQSLYNQKTDIPLLPNPNTQTNSNTQTKQETFNQRFLRKKEFYGQDEGSLNNYGLKNKMNINVLGSQDIYENYDQPCFQFQ